MIRAGNTRDFILPLRVVGTLATTSSDDILVPVTGQIKALYAKLGTAGTTNTQSIDLLKNGSTMMSSGSTFSFPTTVATATYNTANFTTNPPTVNAGDILSLSVGTLQSTPAKDFVCLVTVQRTTDGSQVAAVLTDQV